MFYSTFSVLSDHSQTANNYCQDHYSGTTVTSDSPASSGCFCPVAWQGLSLDNFIKHISWFHFGTLNLSNPLSIYFRSHNLLVHIMTTIATATKSLILFYAHRSNIDVTPISGHLDLVNKSYVLVNFSLQLRQSLHFQYIASHSLI